MSPRKPQGLPYLQLNRVGRLSYVRRIPPDLQVFAGNQKVIRRSLGLRTTNQADPVVIQAWNRIHQETEARLNQAKAAQAGELAEAPGPTPLTPRDRAGIAAEPWRQLLGLVENGVSEPEILARFQRVSRQLIAALPQLQASGDQQQVDRLQAQITEQLLAPVLASLGIRVDQPTYAEMEQRLLGYTSDLRTDAYARMQGDYGSKQLESKAPPLPEKKVSWEEVLEQYAISVGGTTEDDGVGVRKGRLNEYRLYIRDIIKISGKHFPEEITIDDARLFVNKLQRGSLAIRTQQKRVDGLRNLYQMAIQYGLLNSNPFVSMRIKLPRGAEENSYRSFTKAELKAIITRVRSMGNLDRQWVIEALLCTGARAGEILRLRHSDICQSASGIWYLDFKHQPMDGFPTSLKGAQTGERKTPLHPMLMSAEVQKYLMRRSTGYVIDMYNNSGPWSVWFKRSVLVPLGIYESKKTGVHSLRNTAIDLWREAGISGEVRKALVAHRNTDVHDRIYGEGLKNMPEVLYKELKKVNYSNYLE